MKEETIEKVFSLRDWFESVCDDCADYKSVVLLADRKVCRDDLELFYDEEGEPLLAKAFTPQPNEPTIDELLSGTSRKAIASNVILGMTAAFISGALFMAALLLDNAEVAAYTAAVLGGK